MRPMFLAAGLVASAIFAALPASAAPVTAAAPEALAEMASQTALENVQYRPYVSRCTLVRRSCALSYPSRGWRYRRCVAARGCL